MSQKSNVPLEYSISERVYGAVRIRHETLHQMKCLEVEGVLIRSNNEELLSSFGVLSRHSDRKHSAGNKEVNSSPGKTIFLSRVHAKWREYSSLFLELKVASIPINTENIMHIFSFGMYNLCFQLPISKGTWKFRLPVSRLSTFAQYFLDTSSRFLAFWSQSAFHNSLVRCSL